MRFILLLIGSLFFAGCQNQDAYTFLVAGHTYGNSTISFKPGIHPAFKNQFDQINELPNLELAFFAGDIVQKSIPEQWDAIDSDLKHLKAKKYFVAGNHDIANRKLYESRYGPTQYSFKHKNDLFIVMDSNLNDWNIKGAQFDWFEALMAKEAATVNHIFISTHHLVWCPGDNRFDQVTTNWPPAVPATTNFWEEVYPILQKYTNTIVWMAGDLGANHLASPYSLHKEDNLYLIGTGMGFGKPDNILVVEVSGKDLRMTIRNIGEKGLPLIEEID